MEQSPPRSMPRLARRPVRERLIDPVDGASLAVFRMAFGVILAIEVCRFFAHGWIFRYYVEPNFHFTYMGFGWVRPWPAAGMYIHFAVLGVVALCAAAGLLYRATSVLLWLMFTYVFLLEEARYLNHFYAASLFALLLAIVPAASVWSIDARRRPRDAETIPRWALWLMRAQVGAIYFFGGVAKINPDWIHGEPMRSWLMDRAGNPLIDLILKNQLELAFFSYGGLMFDLFITPALLWRRTRPFAFAAAVMFHVINSQLFSIGIFPWMMIAATTLFFAPDWPRAVLRRVRLPVREDAGGQTEIMPGKEIATPLFGVLVLYLVLQVAIPLRHFLYPGNVSWTEEGHLFAWHMKLRDKSGIIAFVVKHRNTGQVEQVDPAALLTSWQVEKMATRPDMILQYAHFLAAQRGGPVAVEVRAQSQVSLNNGSLRAMIDPRADLAAEPRTIWPAWWIEPGDDEP